MLIIEKTRCKLDIYTFKSFLELKYAWEEDVLWSIFLHPYSLRWGSNFRCYSKIFSFNCFISFKLIFVSGICCLQQCLILFSLKLILVSVQSLLHIIAFFFPLRSCFYFITTKPIKKFCSYYSTKQCISIILRRSK